MLFLVLNVIFGSAFILILKWVQTHGRDNVMTVGAINYISAWVLATPEMVWSWPSDIAGESSTPEAFQYAWMMGAMLGCCYFTAFFFVIRAIHRVGASRTTVVGALSILMPIVCGIWLWREHPNTWQWLGVSLAISALILVGGSRQAGVSWSWRTALIVLGFFCLAGLARLAQQGFRHNSLPEWRPVFLWMTFACASIPALFVLTTRHRPTLHEWSVGLGLGIANILQTHFMLLSLRQFESYIVFPVSSAGGVVLTAVVATQILGERINRRSAWGIALATAALILLNAPLSSD